METYTHIDTEAFSATMEKVVNDVNTSAETIQVSIKRALEEYVLGGTKNPTFLNEVINAVDKSRGWSADKARGYILSAAPTLSADGKGRLKNTEKGAEAVVDMVAYAATTWDKFKLPQKDWALATWAKSQTTKLIKEDVPLADALNALKAEYAARENGHGKVETITPAIEVAA